MTPETLLVCKHAVKRYGRVSEAYLMRKLRITWEAAQDVIREFYKRK
jgi:hypothetical protein